MYIDTFFLVKYRGLNLIASCSYIEDNNFYICVVDYYNIIFNVMGDKFIHLRAVGDILPTVSQDTVFCRDREFIFSVLFYICSLLYCWYIIWDFFCHRHCPQICPFNLHQIQYWECWGLDFTIIVKDK